MGAAAAAPGCVGTRVRSRSGCKAGLDGTHLSSGVVAGAAVGLRPREGAAGGRARGGEESGAGRGGHCVGRAVVAGKLSRCERVRRGEEGRSSRASGRGRKDEATAIPFPRSTVSP